jgi:hypothetical protein
MNTIVKVARGDRDRCVRAPAGEVVMFVVEALSVRRGGRVVIDAATRGAEPPGRALCDALGLDELREVALERMSLGARRIELS